VVHAQQADIAFGVSTTLSSSTTISSQSYPLQSRRAAPMRESAPMSFSSTASDFGGNVSWKASQGIYDGYQPTARSIMTSMRCFSRGSARRSGRISRRVSAARAFVSIRTTTIAAIWRCTNYVSSNHFMGHIGGGVRYYSGTICSSGGSSPLLRAQQSEFSSGTIGRVGASIGYNLSPE